MNSYLDRYLIVFAGNVIDQSASTYWFNDVNLFDTVQMKWLPMPVRGTIPHIMWSQTTSVLEGKSRGQGDRLVSVGGCTNMWYMLDTWTLRIGEGIIASNCTLVGPAVENPIVAGTPTYFEIRTVDPAGQQIKWGTGLQFSVFVGGRDATTGLLGQVDALVEELGSGVYKVSFTPASGEQYGCNQLTSNLQIVVRLDGVMIPGAPFSIPIIPSTVGAASIFGPTSATQLASKGAVAVRGHPSVFSVYPQDAFGNPLLLVAEDPEQDVLLVLRLNHYAKRSIDSTPSALEHVARRNRTGGLDRTLFKVLVDGMAPSSSSLTIAELSSEDGGLAIRYVAPDKSSYALSILYDGSPIAGSPFSVSPLENMDVGEGTNLGFIALGFIGLVGLLLLLVLVVAKRNDPRIRASSPTFLVLIVLGAMVGMLSMLMPASTRVTWAGGMSSASCQAYAWLLGLGFSTTFAALLAKTHRIAKIFSSKHLRVVFLPDRELMKPVLAAILLEVVFNVLWTVIDPLRVTISYTSGNPHVPLIVCSSDHLQAWQGVTFLIKMVLVVWAVKLTSSVRSAPGDFNEASALGASLSNIALCGVVLLPLVFFEALEQSPTALYLLKQVVTWWCFLFTPAIIILPKLLEARNATGLAGASQLGGGAGGGNTHIKSHAGSDEGQVLNEEGATGGGGRAGSYAVIGTSTTLGQRPGHSSLGKVVSKVTAANAAANANNNNNANARRWASPANRKSTDGPALSALVGAVVTTTTTVTGAVANSHLTNNSNSTVRRGRGSSNTNVPSVTSPSDVVRTKTKYNKARSGSGFMWQQLEATVSLLCRSFHCCCPLLFGVRSCRD
jgi:hypothetical protein